MLYQGDTKEIENIAPSLAFHLVPSNIDEHLSENLFTSEIKPVLPFLIALANKTSLPTSNSLISENCANNQDKPSQDYFEVQSLAHILENYEAKTILDTTSVRVVHGILESIKNTQK